MYFVDATMIRKVDQNGIISTLLGLTTPHVRPLSCDSSMDVAQVGLSLLSSLSFLITVPHLILSLNVSPGFSLCWKWRGGRDTDPRFVCRRFEMNWTVRWNGTCETGVREK